MAIVWRLLTLASIDNGIPYTPAPPPFTTSVPDLSRAAWDEFYRVSLHMAEMDRRIRELEAAIAALP